MESHQEAGTVSILGPASGGSTKLRSKIFGEKNPESSRKQNVNLLCTSNYLHSTYIVLDSISNLEMIQVIWRMC